MSFPRYPKYKASGVEWLGDVPEQWHVSPLKAVATHNDEALDESTDPEHEILYVDISSVDGVSGISVKEPMPFANAPSRARRRVRDGDVIVSTVRTYLKAIARICDPEPNLIVSTGFAVIRPRTTLVPHFLGHLLSASFFIEQVIARSTGVSYPAINASELATIPVLVPSESEQTTIAAFLDRETGKIDELVAEQRRLIELLKEKRQAVISHAVTNGLNPHAPTKPSGIEWLGDVPEHWEVISWRRLILSLKDFGSNGSFAGLRENVQYLDSPSFARLIRLTDLRENLTNEDGVYVSEDSYRFLSESVLHGGEFLIANVGAYAGLVCEMPPFEMPATLGPNMMMVKKWRYDLVSIKYLITAAQSDVIRQQLWVLATKSSAQPKLNKDDVRSILMPLPPIAEQPAILAFIKHESARFDALISEAQCGIDLLQERRTALNSAAVTGKIDVRGLAQTGVES